jgi:hypothetical protein
MGWIGIIRCIELRWCVIYDITPGGILVDRIHRDYKKMNFHCKVNWCCLMIKSNQLWVKLYFDQPKRCIWQRTQVWNETKMWENLNKFKTVLTLIAPIVSIKISIGKTFELVWYQIVNVWVHILLLLQIFLEILSKWKKNHFFNHFFDHFFINKRFYTIT